MSLFRNLSLRLVCLVAMPAVLSTACGSDDGGTVTPEGTKYTYVINKVIAPSSLAESQTYGLDLNNNGKVDNALGGLLGALKTQGLLVQPALDSSVDDGSVLLLTEFQAKDFQTAGAAGLRVFLGDKATAMPAPCTTPADPTTCKKHLAGTGMFTLSATSPKDTLVAGPIKNGTFTGGPGKISLQIALSAGAPLQLDLIGARAQLSGITDSGFTKGILAGAISKADVDNRIIPALGTQVVSIIAKDCPGATLPACTCMAGSGGETVLKIFDKAPKDCAVTVDEIKTTDFVTNLLMPDVTIDGTPALSIGVGVTAVKGAFTAP
jgi:hypothetical protein